MLRSPEELIEIGFRRSRVVLMNEAHSYWLRCVRTREVGRRILPVAYRAGARHLAMEALWSPDIAAEANRSRRAPEGETAKIGYLAQPEMRALLQDALGLGFTLLHYEGDFDELLSTGLDPMGAELMNLRDEAQARNLARALDALPPDARLLVWCGNGHPYKAHRDAWLPMGYRLRELSGLEPFAIDQACTVAFPDSLDRARGVLDQYAAELRAMGGTGGFLSEDAPVELRRGGVDVLLLSVENELE